MPHVIDKDTGLCIVCNRLEIAAIKEGKKFKRQQYDVRKLAIDRITDKSDPNYRAITNRHYVKYRDSLDESKELHKDAYYLTFDPEVHYRNTFTKKMPVNHAIIEEKFDEYSDEDQEIQQIEDKREYLQSVLDIRSKSKNDRKKLRKINLAQASRLNQVPTITYKVRRGGANATPQLAVIETTGMKGNQGPNYYNNNNQQDQDDYEYEAKPPPTQRNRYPSKSYANNNRYSKRMPEYYEAESGFMSTGRSSNQPTQRYASLGYNPAGYNQSDENDYIDSDTDRRPLRLPPLQSKQPRKPPPRKKEIVRPVIDPPEEEYGADDEHDYRPRAINTRRNTSQRPMRLEPRPDLTLNLNQNDYDDYEDNVKVVKIKPRRKRVVIYHELNEDGEEEGEPQYEEAYEDEEEITIPPPAALKNAKGRGIKGKNSIR